MSGPIDLPPLASWGPTRDTLHQVARVLGSWRARHHPKAKHWWHITLRVTAAGLSTGPVPFEAESVEATLDLVDHSVSLCSSAGWRSSVPFQGHTQATFVEAFAAALVDGGAAPVAGTFEKCKGETTLAYDAADAVAYRRTLVWLDGVFKTFQGGLREETSPVQVFPHHFDLAMNWFSGRLVPGKDPADEEASDEQMNFGFVTGDGAIPEAYVYATAYPTPDHFTDLALVEGARWQTQGWTGAVLPFAAIQQAEDPRGCLLTFLRGLRAHGAKLMQ